MENENTKEEKLESIYDKIKKGLERKSKNRKLGVIVDLDYDFQAKEAYNFLKVYAMGQKMNSVINKQEKKKDEKKN